MQGVKGKHPPNNTGNLQRQLLLQGQSVNAAGDHALDCVWKRHRWPIAHVHIKQTFASFDPHQASVTKRVGDFLAPKWVAFGFGVNQRRNLWRQRLHTQPLGDERLDFAGG